MHTQVLPTARAFYYLAEIEKEVKRILASLEGHSKVEKPRLAQGSWPEGQRVPDYYGSLHNMMLSDWSKTYNAPSVSNIYLRKAEVILREVALWEPNYRKIFWWRQGGLTWSKIYREMGRKNTLAELKGIYDLCLGNLAQKLVG